MFLLGLAGADRTTTRESFCSSGRASKNTKVYIGVVNTGCRCPPGISGDHGNMKGGRLAVCSITAVRLWCRYLFYIRADVCFQFTKNVAARWMDEA